MSRRQQREPARRILRTRIPFALLGPVVGAAILGLLAPSVAAPNTGSGKHAVATEAPRATREAMAILRQGGSAADAAVTAALVAGVVNSSSSGIGGGAFILYWDATRKAATVLDARETAGGAIDTEAFEARPFDADNRGKWVGVPGEVRGLYDLHQRQGRLRWQDVVAPAAQVASQGFRLGKHMANMLTWAKSAVSMDRGLKGLFLNRGNPLAFGARVKNAALARTLNRIALEGPNAFYEGPVATDIVAATRKHNGALSLEDLATYQVEERRPLMVDWGSHRVYTMPPPSAGGLMLVQAMKLFTKEELQALGYNTPAYQHMLAEAFRASIADRAKYLGDPAHQTIPLAQLLSKARMARRRARISPDRTHAIPRFTIEEHGTHHLITADQAGNFVSLTTTINRAFGSKIMAAESGVVLNDELDDFTQLRHVSALGLRASPNRPRAGARPVSSMTPTIAVRNGKVVLAAGGSGGMNIATNVSQAVLSQLAFGLPAHQLVAAPRFQIPVNGAYINLPSETERAHVEDLKRRGEIVGKVRFRTSAVQMITRVGQQLHPASDPRKHGSAKAD